MSYTEMPLNRLQFFPNDWEGGYDLVEIKNKLNYN
jgi:hypothetical protein